MGWSFGDDREKFTVDEMVASFSWDKVSLGGPVFDLTKLNWLNQKYIQELSDDGLADALLGWRLSRDHLRRLVPLARDRIQRLDEFFPLTEYFFSGDLDYAKLLPELVIPDVPPAGVAQGVLTFVDRLEALAGWSKAQLDPELRAWAAALGWKNKHAFMLLRLALTGRKATPSLDEVMVVLGKELTRRRLREVAKALSPG
jgi:glutamyl-tRNA synthetase